MSACTFVSPVINSGAPISDQDRKAIQDDVHIIDRSLHFINDLLRSMLDVHLATSNSLNLEKEAVSIRHDLFEPVASLIYTRDSTFTVLFECCPDDLVVEADRLRLQQVVLNLARNSAKFLEKGYIKFKAQVVIADDSNDGEGDGTNLKTSVQISVEDSGPGIPKEKRGDLFGRFQNIRLDKARQGTGVGLFLSSKLVQKMGGELFLDEGYKSTLEGSPGARLVIDLKQPPMEIKPSKTEEATINESSFEDLEAPKPKLDASATTPISVPVSVEQELPENFSVLFVDDDLILRKQSARAMGRLRPNWVVRQAASGESALKILETESFDIIFMDQYSKFELCICSHPFPWIVQCAIAS